MAESTSGKRRIVRNPETFRERAVKATTQSEQPRRRSQLAQWLSKPFRLLGRGLTRLFRIQPFRAVGFVFIWIGRILFPRYFRNSWRELRLVSWPNWQQSRQLTFAVLAFAIVFGALIAGVDYGLDKLFKQVLLK